MSLTHLTTLHFSGTTFKTNSTLHHRTPPCNHHNFDQAQDSGIPPNHRCHLQPRKGMFAHVCLDTASLDRPPACRHHLMTQTKPRPQDHLPHCRHPHKSAPSVPQRTYYCTRKSVLQSPQLSPTQPIHIVPLWSPLATSKPNCVSKITSLCISTQFRIPPTCTTGATFHLIPVATALTLFAPCPNRGYSNPSHTLTLSPSSIALENNIRPYPTSPLCQRYHQLPLPPAPVFHHTSPPNPPPILRPRGQGCSSSIKRSQEVISQVFTMPSKHS